MYVEDVEDIKTSHNRCILKYVEDVEDRSNTHKGSNAMYVEDVEDIKTSHNRFCDIICIMTLFKWRRIRRTNVHT